MDRNLIEQYAAGAEVPAKAIVGLEKSDLNAFPVPGTWSIQQIILHLMDSDLIGSDRMKRVAAEDKPALLAYNETAFASRLGYEHLSVRDAAEIFRLNRLMTAEILRRLPATAFSRTGLHSEQGEVTLEQLVATYVGHVEHHLKFIREKRSLLGKPM
jgi:DinB superfamily